MSRHPHLLHHLHRLLEHHPWLVAEADWPEYRAARLLDRNNAAEIATWLLEAPRWRILDPRRIDPLKPGQGVVLEGEPFQRWKK
ncbi:MAG: hypothetical protein N2313_04275 [Meiothermus ruber]|nr:hypothetical protein [Chloracidobacterium sp.]MCX7802219.1 hypothetical protein [Meiothermus ruber]